MSVYKYMHMRVQMHREFRSGYWVPLEYPDKGACKQTNHLQEQLLCLTNEPFLQPQDCVYQQTK